MKLSRKLRLRASIVLIVILCGFFINFLSQSGLTIPVYHLKTSYYELDLTSYIKSFKLQGHECVEYCGWFSTEENALWKDDGGKFENIGKWSLEIFDSCKILSDNNTRLILQTKAHLFTYETTKTFTFYKTAAWFEVFLNRTYWYDSGNINNQIILDMKGEPRITYTVTKAEPNNFTIQNTYTKDIKFPDGRTEVQFNFYGLEDRDYRRHSGGEQEQIWFRVEVYPFMLGVYS